MQIKITEATPSQLAEFAIKNLGVEVNYRTGRDKILTAMEAAGFSGDTIEVDAEAAPTVQAEPDVESAKRIRILVPTQDGPGGKEAIVVGVNGRVTRIQRGVEVAVRPEVIGVLKNANRVVYDKDENGTPINPTEVPTHGFQILGPAA